MKKKIVFILGWIILAFVGSYIALFFIPVKSTVILDENIKEQYRQLGQIVIVCKHAQVTGGSWLVEDVIAGDETMRGQFIDARGNVPVVDYERFSNGLAGGENFIFIGDFTESQMLDGVMIEQFVSYQWDVVYPFSATGIISFKKKYLNIFDYKRLTEYLR